MEHRTREMQNLALALEGSAIECLREVREDEPGAYEKIWRVLAHRFGHLDEPERAMRRFDSRKQLEGEVITKYEQTLRTLYREAWPHADEATKDSTLKRKFEDGLTSAEMLQFLRLHAKTDDFAQTMAKARRFAETQEAVKPKKSVRIVEARYKDHNMGAVQQVIQMALQDKAQIASVTSVPIGSEQSKRSETSNRSPSPAPSNRSSGSGNQPRREEDRRPAGQSRQNRQDGSSFTCFNGKSNGNNRSYEDRNGRASPSPARSFANHSS